MTIRHFESPKDREAFRALNEEWIAKFFVLEEADKLVLWEPEEHILAPGGSILMAFDGEETPVGCCALIPCHKDHTVVEMAKLAVSPKCQGQGIGRLLVDAIIAEGRRKGARMMRLETNSVLQSALRIYESSGFVHVAPDPDTPYARANVFMELPL